MKKDADNVRTRRHVLRPIDTDRTAPPLRRCTLDFCDIGQRKSSIRLHATVDSSGDCCSSDNTEASVFGLLLRTRHAYDVGQVRFRRCVMFGPSGQRHTAISTPCVAISCCPRVVRLALKFSHGWRDLLDRKSVV